jgi:hypothetical protein
MLRSAAALGAYEQKEKPINANASPRFRQGCRKQPRWRAPRAGPEDLAATASTFACLRASCSSNSTQVYEERVVVIKIKGV